MNFSPLFFINQDKKIFNFELKNRNRKCILLVFTFHNFLNKNLDLFVLHLKRDDPT